MDVVMHTTFASDENHTVHKELDSMSVEWRRGGKVVGVIDIDDAGTLIVSDPSRHFSLRLSHALEKEKTIIINDLEMTVECKKNSAVIDACPGNGRIRL